MSQPHYIFLGDLDNYLEQSKSRNKELKRLLTQCETYFTVKLTAEHPNGSSTYMAFAELNLALAYLLTKDEKYAKEAKRWMLCVCGYKKWGHAHLVNVDLSASWNLFGLSITYNWLSDVLSSEEKKIIHDKIALQAEILYTYAKEHQQAGWAVQFLQNHNWINFTGLAAAGYALKNDLYIKTSKEDFAQVYNLLTEDGSDYEGVVYWRYGAMWLFIYAHLLKTEENINYFEKCQFLRNTFYYRLYQSAPDLSRQLNFGDCHDTHSGHPACVYRLVAKEYKDTYAQYLGSFVINSLLEEEASMSKVKPGILPEAFLEYLWYDPTVKETSVETLPVYKYFPDLGLVSLRSDWTPNAKVFTYKCGYPGGKKQWLQMGAMKDKDGVERRGLSHNHPDHLSYVIVNGKNYFTAEDGYNRNIMEYHHSSLLVDGRLCDKHDVNDVYLSSFKEREKNSLQKNDDYFGEISNVKYENGLLSFMSDAHRFYPLDLQMKEVSRFVVSDGKSFVAFIDTFDSDKEHLYSALCNTYEVPKAIDGVNSYEYPDTAMFYHVLPLSTTETECPQIEKKLQVHEVVSVMTTQEPDKVCKVTMQSLSHTSKTPVKKVKMLEVISFSNDVKIEIDGEKVTIGNYCIDGQSVTKK